MGNLTLVVKNTVRYTERVSAGQMIVLAEQSGHELGSLHGAKGTPRFKPAPGGGRRDIVAPVTRATVTVRPSGGGAVSARLRR